MVVRNLQQDNGIEIFIFGGGILEKPGDNTNLFENKIFNDDGVIISLFKSK